MRLRRGFVLGIFLAFAAALLPQGAGAQDALGAMKARGRMIVGVKTDYPPFGYLENDRNVGLEIDLLHAIAKDMFGNPDAIDFVPVIAANRFQFLSTAKIDFLFSTVTITDQRKAVVDFSAPYMKSGWQLLVPRSNDSIHDAPDLAGKTVVVVPGSTGEAGLARRVPSATLLKLNLTSEALQAVHSGRAAAFVQDAALLYGLTREAPQFKIVGKSYDEMPIAAACRKGDAAPCAYVSREIEKFKRNGTLRSLYRKWLQGAADRFMP